MKVEAEIREIVDRETRAWDTQDVALLLSVFHPDMVWPWPRTYTSVDPVDWRLVLGRFDEERWRRFFEEHFAAHELVHNRRSLAKIEVSAEGDGALAVVDIDTLWRARSTWNAPPYASRFARFIVISAKCSSLGEPSVR